MRPRLTKTHYIGAGEPAQRDEIRTYCGRVAYYDMAGEADTARCDRIDVTWDARKTTCSNCLYCLRRLCP